MAPTALRLLALHTAVVVLLACIGCRPSAPDEKLDFLTGVDPQFIEQHGQLIFVKNVELGCKLATDRRMPCLFFFTAKWCKFCHQMAETAFDDPAVGRLGREFVCVIVDADRERDLCHCFSVTGFPTVEFVSPHGQSLHRLVGQQSSADLATGMQAALGRFAWLDQPLVR